MIKLSFSWNFNNFNVFIDLRTCLNPHSIPFLYRHALYIVLAYFIVTTSPGSLLPKYIQSTLDISNCQGTNKFVRDIESSTVLVIGKYSTSFVNVSMLSATLLEHNTQTEPKMYVWWFFLFYIRCMIYVFVFSLFLRRRNQIYSWNKITTMLRL